MPQYFCKQHATQTLTTITAIVLETYQVSRRITLTAKQYFWSRGSFAYRKKEKV